MNFLKLLTTVSSTILFSRLLGFVREITIATFFGVSAATDAFFIAFRLPNILRRIFSEGAFSNAFMSVLSEYKNKKNEKLTYNFLSDVIGTFIFVLGIITIIGILFAPWIVKSIFPGFKELEEKLNLIIILLRIILPHVFFISLVSLSTSILNTYGYFFVPAFTPALFNIIIISSVFLLHTYCKPPIVSLALGVFMGGIFQLIYQLCFLKKIKMLIRPSFSFFNEKGSLKVVRLMGPAVVGMSITQISSIINSTLVSFLEIGSVSWMYYADRLIELPVGILGVGLCTITFPSLTKSFLVGNRFEYQRLMDFSLRVCFLLSLPCTVILIIFSYPLVVSLFKYGSFSFYDVRMTQYALIGYSIGVTGLILVKILVSGFYSIQNIKTPVKIAVVTLLITQIMNCIFLSSLKHTGLTLSASLAGYFNAIVLYLKLRYKNIFSPFPGWKKFFMQLFISLLIMIIVSLITLNCVQEWDRGNMFIRVLRLLSSASVGIFSYIISLFLLGFRKKDLYRSKDK